MPTIERCNPVTGDIGIGTLVTDSMGGDMVDSEGTCCDARGGLRVNSARGP